MSTFSLPKTQFITSKIYRIGYIWRGVAGRKITSFCFSCSTLSNDDWHDPVVGRQKIFSPSRCRSTCLSESNSF